ncbi:MAG: hypothetical protein J0M26_10215 [Planctomycetes bacterium]|nr:hypothetical protein [Planctomycetota bacterium]
MGSRNSIQRTSMRTEVNRPSVFNASKLLNMKLNSDACAKWLAEFQLMMKQLAQLSGSRGLLAPAVLPVSRSRVMRIDNLESRELFAVLSGLVFEDVNQDQRFDPSVDIPAIHQWVFLDQNGNSLFDQGESTLMSNDAGIAEFHLDFGSWGTILPVSRLQDTAAASSSTYIPLSVAAFDTVFRGDDAFDPAARLSGGLTDWLIIPNQSEGEGDLVGDAVTVQTRPLAENDTNVSEVGEILLYGQAPPEGWVWLVSDDRFDIVGNKIYTKAETPVNYEHEAEIVMVVEGYDNSNPSPASSSTQKATVTLTILDQNDAPTGIYLAGNTVVERVTGASVGAVQVVDEDGNEPFAYAVSDQRFEIVGGLLKLRSDVALLHDQEPFVDLVISATSLLDPTHYVEATAHIEVLPNSKPWTNETLPLDVNGDGVISATDALIIINILNASGGTLALPPIATSRNARSTPDYVDVNGDGNVGTIDALIVINRIRRDNAAGTAGGANR